MNCVEVVRLRRFKLNSMFENISRTKRVKSDFGELEKKNVCA